MKLKNPLEAATYQAYCKVMWRSVCEFDNVCCFECHKYSSIWNTVNAIRLLTFSEAFDSDSLKGLFHVVPVGWAINVDAPLCQWYFLSGTYLKFLSTNGWSTMNQYVRIVISTLMTSQWRHHSYVCFWAPDEPAPPQTTHMCFKNVIPHPTAATIALQTGCRYPIFSNFIFFLDSAIFKSAAILDFPQTISASDSASSEPHVYEFSWRNSVE